MNTLASLVTDWNTTKYDLAEAYAERHNIATDNTLDIKSNPRWKGLKSIGDLPILGSNLVKIGVQGAIFDKI